MPVAGAALELAALTTTPLATVGSVRALGAKLQPVFTTNFRRESRMLKLDDGSDVEFVFDVGIVAAGRGKARRTLAIREVEIELKAQGGRDPEAALMRFAARLARDLPLIPLAASKASRGYRLSDRSALLPAKVELPRARPDDRPEVFLADVLEACNRALLANVHALFEIADAGPVHPATSNEAAVASAIEADLEFVHQARVAVRRLRSALRTFAPVAKGRRIDALDDRLGEIGRLFGAARDWDVFVTTTRERLDDEVATDAEGRAALVDLEADATMRRIDAHRSLMAGLDAGLFGETAIAIDRLAARLRSVAADDATTLATRAPRWLSKQSDRIVERSRRIAVLDHGQRHGLRVEVKRLRYALDLLEGLYDEAAVKGYRDAVAGLQDRLGKLNDAVVAETLMQSLPAGDALALARSRFGAWLERHVPKQLPKVAALSVALELMPRPWVPPA